MPAGGGTEELKVALRIATPPSDMTPAHTHTHTHTHTHDCTPTKAESAVRNRSAITGRVAWPRRRRRIDSDSHEHRDLALSQHASEKEKSAYPRDNEKTYT